MTHAFCEKAPAPASLGSQNNLAPTASGVPLKSRC